MKASLFLFNESARVSVNVAVGIEADKLTRKHEAAFDFWVRGSALQLAPHKLPIALLAFVASLEGFLVLTLANPMGLAV